MSKINEIASEIWSFINEDNGQIIDNDKHYEEVYDVIDYVNKKFGVNIEVENVGSFDSPGYAMTCYAWAGIIDGELYFDCLEMECY